MSTGNLIAFHGDAQLKNDMLAELALHRAQDQIIKGNYSNGGEGEAFKGCAVGCSIHSLNVKRGLKLKTSDHAAYEAGFGIPRQLAYLEDRIFENLEVPLHLAWPERFMAAIKPGADLSMVVSRFMLWMLADSEEGVIKFAKRAATITAIEGVAELYRRKLAGQEIKREEWIKAQQAAADADAYAYAASASADAASAAAAAYAASDAYADAAYADAASASADAAAIADADAYAYARQEHWQRMANKLIELMEAA